MPRHLTPPAADALAPMGGAAAHRPAARARPAAPAISTLPRPEAA